MVEHAPGGGPRSWGRAHGEEFREGIRELAGIRRGLMLARNPGIEGDVPAVAAGQLEASARLDRDLAAELRGIAEGAATTVEDVVVLNNYTDFRDVGLPGEGCSTVHARRGGGASVAGQTWDMHGSAVDYVCLVSVPPGRGRPGAVLFSLVGCLGMMGVNSARLLVGVNNLNTRGDASGVVWPLLVRRLLKEGDAPSMARVLKGAAPAGGRNYMLSGRDGALHVEVAPGAFEEVGGLGPGEEGAAFHTNHCVGRTTRPLERASAVSSTSRARHALLGRKARGVAGLAGLVALLRDHDGYPRSICSHFESGAQDPSMTCGGGAADLDEGRCVFWKGCPRRGDGFRERAFVLDGGRFREEPRSLES